MTDAVVAGNERKALADTLLPRVDFNRAFDGLTDIILQSSFGTALSMFGGARALQPLREPFVGRMQEFLRSVAEDREVLADIAGHSTDALLLRVEGRGDGGVDGRDDGGRRGNSQRHPNGWMLHSFSSPSDPDGS